MATENDIIKDALDRFEESQDGSDFNRKSAEEDIRFARLGDQWPDIIKGQREAEARPCLTINKMPSFIRQVVNDTRQNKPAIVVSPVDNDSDVDTADIISGLIRHIERNSNADVAYDTAIDHSVTSGFGFFQIAIEYVDAESFDMEAVIQRIQDPLSVHWDINSTRFDASDWNYAFVSDFIKKEDFKREYPDFEPADFEGDATSKRAGLWVKDDHVRIADYWSREETKTTLYLLSDGQVIKKDILPQMARAFIANLEIDPGKVSDDEISGWYLQSQDLEIKRTREAKDYKVVKRVISGRDVLAEDPWPGKSIPICPVWGEEVVSQGRRYFRSLTRDAQDPQRMFNYWRSAGVEMVALAPKAPFVGPKGFAKGSEEKWRYAHTKNFPYLEYDPTFGKPERQGLVGIPSGALQETLNSNDDMKSIVGIYDPSLGARSNETSGRAITARQRESDVSNFHFPDNLNRAIQYAGKCLVEIIPSVYSSRQAIRILGEDEKESIVRLGQAGQEANSGKGEKLYDLTTGRYDVAVKSGPSYASQREETRETLIEIMRTVPGAGQFIGDIVMEHLDFQGADRVAQRLKMLLPEQLREAETQEGLEGMDPEVQAMLGQANKTIQALKQALQEAKDEKMPEQERLNIEKAEFALDKDLKQAELRIKQVELEMKRAELAMKKDETDYERVKEVLEGLSNGAEQAAKEGQPVAAS